MSTFKVQVLRITIEPHPNADALEFGRVGEYRSVVRKGQFKTGDLAVFIPPAAILPEWIITKLGLEGRLAGKAKNRVKEVRLRGQLSEGLFFPVNGEANDVDIERPVEIEGHPGAGEVLLIREGDDVAEFLGITKYEPVIPTHMNGEVCNVSGYTLKYDIENYKRYPDIFGEDTRVTVTEKLHGCASYETIINTIEYNDIKIGDLVTQKQFPCYVKSFNTTTNEVEYNLVENVSELPNNDDWYEIETETGELVKLTGNHLVWLPTLKCYREVKLLTEEDYILLGY